MAGRVGSALISLLMRSAQVEVHGAMEEIRPRRREDPPRIFLCWHGSLLPILWFMRHRGIVALASEHSDGELVARIIRHLGFEVVRGSSSRGGVRGLLALVRAAEDGKDIAVVPDGPRGPRHVLKPGVLLPARRLGLPVIPIAAGVERAWVLRSWDRMEIPRPFSRIRIDVGAPFRVSPGIDDSGMAQAASELEDRMRHLAARAVRGIEADPMDPDERKEEPA